MASPGCIVSIQWRTWDKVSVDLIVGYHNPQGIVCCIVATTGQVWTHEHGPKGGDEINVVQCGRNYGWPVITFGKNSPAPSSRETQNPIPSSECILAALHRGVK